MSSSSWLCGWKLASITMSPARAASANSSSNDAAPSRSDHASSISPSPGTNRASCSVSLIRSFVTSEYPSSAASGPARLLFPAPSLPETYAILLTRPILAQASACSRWIAPGLPLLPWRPGRRPAPGTDRVARPRGPALVRPAPSTSRTRPGGSRPAPGDPVRVLTGGAPSSGCPSTTPAHRSALKCEAPAPKRALKNLEQL